MIQLSDNINVNGLTFSSVNPNIYKEYDDNKDGEVFEKVVFDLMLNKYSEDKELTEYVLSLPKEQQRMAVLSLIDDDNNLWTKMNTFVDECNDELEHIKDVIKIMFKFVKEGEVEKKKFGEVMTPLELVKEMLSTLPKDVWSNPNLKWLDPCNGAGTFPLVVIYKLMKGLSEWEPNVEKRYKHIVENMIYTCELQSRNVFLWLCGVDPKDKYTTNTYWGSFLDKDFDFHMKTIWGVDRFDVVVGNPPYQSSDNKSNKLWVKFTDKLLNICDNLSFVVPISLIKSESSQIRKIRMMLSDKENMFNLKYQDIFNIGDKVVFFTTLKSENKTTKIITDSNIRIIDNISLSNRLASDDLEDIKLSIFRKIEDIKFDKFNFIYDFYHGSNQTTPNRLIEKKIVSKERNDIYKYIVHHSASNTLYAKDVHSTFGKIKVLFNYSGGFIGEKYMFITKNLIGKQMVGILVDSEIEGENLIKTYSKKIFEWYIKNEKSGGFNTGIFKLPVLDYNKEWDDYKLFEYFDLTEAEINLILNT